MKELQVDSQQLFGFLILFMKGLFMSNIKINDEKKLEEKMNIKQDETRKMRMDPLHLKLSFIQEPTMNLLK